VQGCDDGDSSVGLRNEEWIGIDDQRDLTLRDGGSFQVVGLQEDKMERTKVYEP